MEIGADCDILKIVQNYPIILCEKTASFPKVADIINHER
jgi:hypothetical protein